MIDPGRMCRIGGQNKLNGHQFDCIVHCYNIQSLLPYDQLLDNKEIDHGKHPSFVVNHRRASIASSQLGYCINATKVTTTAWCREVYTRGQPLYQAYTPHLHTHVSCNTLLLVHQFIVHKAQLTYGSSIETKPSAGPYNHDPSSSMIDCTVDHILGVCVQQS